MATVYAVINESLTVGATVALTEVVQPLRYRYQDALDDLAAIAEENGVYLDDDSTSVYLPVKGTHLESEEYYIDTFEVMDRG